MFARGSKSCRNYRKVPKPTKLAGSECPREICVHDLQLSNMLCGSMVWRERMVLCTQGPGVVMGSAITALCFGVQAILMATVAVLNMHSPSCRRASTALSKHVPVLLPFFWALGRACGRGSVM